MTLLKNFLKRKKLIEELKFEKSSRCSYRLESISLLDDGKSVSKIAEFLFLDEGSVRNYKRSYAEGGLEQLVLGQ